MTPHYDTPDESELNMATATAETAVQNVISKVVTWGKRFGFLALIAFVLLSLAKVFGLNVWPVQTMGPQEFGVFVAGTAYALSR